MLNENEINEVYEKYSNRKISAEIDFDKTTISEHDINIINNNPIIQSNKNYWNNFFLNELPLKVNNYLEPTIKATQKVNNVNVKIGKNGDAQNLIKISPKFIYNYVYFSPFDYYFFQKQNSFMVKINYLLHSNRSFGKPKPRTSIKDVLDEDEVNFGFIFNTNKSKRSFLLNNTSYLFNDKVRWVNAIKFSKGTWNWVSPTFEKIIKTHFIYDLLPKSVIFREYLPFDPIKQLALKISHKSLNVHTENSQDTLLPGHDTQICAKLSFERNNLNMANFENIHLKASANLVCSLNSLYLKTKIFMRKIFSFEHYSLQTNLEVAGLTSLNEKETNDLNIFEKLYVYNFRGVQTVGRKDENSKANNNTFYAMMKNKVYFKSFPFFNKFSYEDDGFVIRPFTQLNILANPTTSKDSEDSYSSLHLSTGFGLSFISRLISFELNYLPYIKSNKDEIKAKVNLTIGID